MDYEKAYKDALERARNLHKDAIDMDENIRAKQCEIIFPELTESEDENMKNWILDELRLSYKFADGDRDRCDELLKAISWLEKQGEHAIACSEEQMKVLDEVLNFAANHESPYWNDYIFGTLCNLIRQLNHKAIKL